MMEITCIYANLKIQHVYIRNLDQDYSILLIQIKNIISFVMEIKQIFIQI